MPTNEKITTKTIASKGADDFSDTYVQLRTVLDALEISALRYVLQDENALKRKTRAEKVISLAMDLIKNIGGGGPEAYGCPEGMWMCNGVCVPYPCMASKQK